MKCDFRLILVEYRSKLPQIACFTPAARRETQLGVETLAVKAKIAKSGSFGESREAFSLSIRTRPMAA